MGFKEFLTIKIDFFLFHPQCSIIPWPGSDLQIFSLGDFVSEILQRHQAVTGKSHSTSRRPGRAKPCDLTLSTTVTEGTVVGCYLLPSWRS